MSNQLRKNQSDLSRNLRELAEAVYGIRGTEAIAREMSLQRDFEDDIPSVLRNDNVFGGLLAAIRTCAIFAERNIDDMRREYGEENESAANTPDAQKEL